MKITLLDAEKAARAIGINFATEKFNAYDLMIGMEVELEHGTISKQTNVTNDDLVTTAKIALAHLRELPDYYERLEEMERTDLRKKVAAERAPGTVGYIIGLIIVAAFIVVIFWVLRMEYNYAIYGDPEVLKYRKQ